MGTRIKRLKVCLNGARSRDEHPAVPLAPAELAASAAVEWLRILIEITDVPAQKAVRAADEVLRRLTDLGVTPPRLLHGEGPGCWPLIAHAGRLGLPTRIGLEDTSVGPDGSAASGNAELVQAALQAWTSATAGSASGTVPAPE